MISASLRSRRTAVLTALAIAAAGIPAVAHAARVIDSSSARGPKAAAAASGSVERPRALWVKVRTRPPQRVRGHWSTFCTRGVRARGMNGGFRGSGTFRLRMPMPFRRPDTCEVSAGARLKRSGRIRVTLLAR